MAARRGDTLLIQFARLPRPGAVKTRMQAAMSAADACALHEALMQWTCRCLLAARLGPVELWLDELDPHPLVDACLAAGVRGPRLQRGADLGERMHHALADGLDRYQRVLLVGSDCPALDASYLQRARDALEQRDCVLGPAEDGGYVLIGARRIEPGCLQQVAWGTADAYRHTLRQLEARGYSWQSLPARRDVDRPEDLPYWLAIREAGLSSPD
jgi:rSAM/selenodomain-associated transferase 1